MICWRTGRKVKVAKVAKVAKVVGIGTKSGGPTGVVNFINFGGGEAGKGISCPLERGVVTLSITLFIFAQAAT